MSTPPLPDVERLLLGPGPSPVSPRIMRAMAAPVLSHLDPDMLQIMDDLRARLGRVFMAPADGYSLAVSGTGSAGMEMAVANLVREGTHVLVIVSGYFGERLADLCSRYGALVGRLDVPWGRAVDPEMVRRALKQTPADIVAMVHAETSTGVLNPVEAVAQIAREQGCLMLVDAVTSLGAHPVDVAGWQLDAVYSCTQKGLGAPSGMAPICFSKRAKERAKSRSFYFDLGLLEAYWSGRKYHHTISAPLVYAVREALVAVEEETLEARFARHRRHHMVLAAGLGAMGLELLPPEGERLWTLNAVCVPGRRRRGRRAQVPAAAVQPRDRRRPRPARRPHLARRADGQRIEQPVDPAVPQRAGAGAAGAGRRGVAGDRHGGSRRRTVVAHRRLRPAWPAGSTASASAGRRRS